MGAAANPQGPLAGQATTAQMNRPVPGGLPGLPPQGGQQQAPVPGVPPTFPGRGGRPEGGRPDGGFPRGQRPEDRGMHQRPGIDLGPGRGRRIERTPGPGGA